MGFRRPPSKTDFEREVMPHLPALYGVALRMTKNQGDAEDLVQESVLRAYRFFDSFEAGTNCKAWLFRILTNTFCNRYREREREQEILGEAESSEANLGQFLAGAPRDAETALFGSMLSKDVERALAAVPAEFRLAVVLADLEDFSYKEIAEIMDCPATCPAGSPGGLAATGSTSQPRPRRPPAAAGSGGPILGGPPPPPRR